MSKKAIKFILICFIIGQGVSFVYNIKLKYKNDSLLEYNKFFKIQNRKLNKKLESLKKINNNLKINNKILKEKQQELEYK